MTHTSTITPNSGTPNSGTPNSGTPLSSTPLARLDAALAAPISTMTVHEVRAQMHLARAAKAVAEARLLQLNRRLTELASQSVAVDPVRELRHHGGLCGREVRAVAMQSEAVEAAPVLGDLLTAGVTTARHVESVGHALSAVGDSRDALLGHVPEITQRATSMGADQFDRYVKRLVRTVQADDGMTRFQQQRRSIALRLWTDRDGMLRYAGGFDPEFGAVFASAIERRVEAMFHSGDQGVPLDIAPGIDPNDHRRALALYAMCTRADSPTDDAVGDPFDARPARAEIVVHVDHRTLVAGLHQASVCRTNHGGDIPPAVARRLACEAEIIPIVLSGEAVPLDVGRAKRLATLHHRRALEARHTTCAIDDCDTVFTRCVIHHLDPWEHGGRSDLSNLVPLCNRHHHAVHDHGWRLTLDPHTRRLTVTLPGTPVDDPP